MKKNLFLFLIMIIIFKTTTINAQYEYNEDKDSHTYFSIVSNIHSPNFSARDEIYDDMQGDIGYSVGLSLTTFPDFEQSNILFRGMILYSKESATKENVVFKNVLTDSRINLESIRFDMFFGYKSANYNGFQPYFGLGLAFQQAINSRNDRFFITQNNIESSVFDSDFPNLPQAYEDGLAPGGMITPYIEVGALYPLGNRYIGVNLGLGYGFMAGGNNQTHRFSRSLLSLGLNYELFR